MLFRTLLFLSIICLHNVVAKISMEDLLKSIEKASGKTLTDAQKEKIKNSVRITPEGNVALDKKINFGGQDLGNIEMTPEEVADMIEKQKEKLTNADDIFDPNAGSGSGADPDYGGKMMDSMIESKFEVWRYHLKYGFYHLSVEKLMAAVNKWGGTVVGVYWGMTVIAVGSMWMCCQTRRLD